MDIGGANLGITAGSGFQVSEVQQGQYRITFNTAFSGIPTVVANIRESLNTATGFTQVANVNSATADIQLYLRDSGAFIYRHFDFIAIGPR